jgi:transposase
MTGRLLAQTRQRHCFTTRATGAANTRSDILPITLESSRPMLTPALANYTMPSGVRGRLPRPRVGAMGGAAKAIGYMLKRWPAFTRFLDDGRICLSNNAAERALRGIALGRKVWLFAGSDRGGERAAAMYTLIGTAKLNGVDPQAWLADVLRRIADHPASHLSELLPWNREEPAPQAAAAAA